jgi:hypothetical protein
MVKGFDPTKSDVAALLLNRLGELYRSDPHITLQDSEKYVRHWLQHSQHTSAIYNQFRTLSLAPKIRLIKKCYLPVGVFKDAADRYFPSHSNTEEVTICMNNISNKIELKEHLDRELTFLYLDKLKNVDENLEQRERTLIRNVY